MTCEDLARALDTHRMKLAGHNPKAEAEHAELAMRYLACTGGVLPRRKYRGR